MNEVEIEIETTKVFREIKAAFEDGYGTISMQGSSRSSKTYNALIWLIIYCMQHPNTRISVVRSTLPAIRGSVFVDFKDILIKMGIFDSKKLNKTEFTYHFANGSWVEFFSTDDEQKLRGRKRDILFVNEANELSYIEWQQLKMRTSLLSIIDYNPSFSDEHWICKLNSDDRTYHFISTYKDNPFLEKSIIDEIESLQRKNESLWKIYGLGIQSQIEGLIFKNVEIIDEMPPAKQTFIGLDFGFTNDPTVIVRVAITDDSIYIDELCYRTEMIASDIIRELKKYAENSKIISESADPRLIREIRNAGINIYPVEKYNGSIEAGINKMLEYRIKVTKNSLSTINEFRNYAYQQDRDGKWLNQPIDAFNHSIDAIRYIVLTEKLGTRVSRGVRLLN